MFFWDGLKEKQASRLRFPMVIVMDNVGIGVFLYCSLLYGMFLFVWNVPCDDSRSMSHSFDSTELRDGTFMIEYTRHY